MDFIAKFEGCSIRRRFHSGLPPSSNEPKILYSCVPSPTRFSARCREFSRCDRPICWHGCDQVPFVPFRLCLNSGRTYEIRHPEMLRVGRSSVNIYSFVGAPEDPYERMEMISLVLIERIEPIETAIPA